MGAWGAGVYDNDDALDLLARLHDEGPSVLVAVVDEALQPGAYLDVDTGAGVVVAADLAARLTGAALPPHPDADALVASWSRVPVTIDTLVEALDAIVDANRSELASLWGPAPNAWSRSVAALRSALRP